MDPLKTPDSLQIRTALRRCALVVFAIALAACGSSARQDGAPVRKLDPAKIKDAVPRREPITRAGNKSPYTVLGRTYVLLPSAKGYRATGTASWYGTKFHGQSTSNGEKYDLYEMTAAHKTLPIPSYVLVTNLENNRQAIVRVNDRGPFVSNRIIDLSYAAAVKLGYADKGTAFVEVAAIDVDNWPPRDAPAVPPPVSPPRAIEAPPLASAQPPVSAQPLSRSVSPVPQSPASDAEFYVQAGAFGDRLAAESLRDRLARVQSHAVSVQPTASSPALYRVRIGPLRDRAAAEQVREQLLNQHMSEAARVVEVGE